MSKSAMAPEDIRAAFMDELVSIAPDIDAESISDDDHLMHDLGLDSMDFLNLVIALHKHLGVAIAESDYPQIATPGKAVNYLQNATA
jgi:acyl carrier protein